MNLQNFLQLRDSAGKTKTVKEMGPLDSKTLCVCFEKSAILGNKTLHLLFYKLLKTVV